MDVPLVVPDQISLNGTPTSLVSVERSCGNPPGYFREELERDLKGATVR